MTKGERLCKKKRKKVGDASAPDSRWRQRPL